MGLRASREQRAKQREVEEARVREYMVQHKTFESLLARLKHCARLSPEEWEREEAQLIAEFEAADTGAFQLKDGANRCLMHWTARCGRSVELLRLVNEKSGLGFPAVSCEDMLGQTALQLAGDNKNLTLAMFEWLAEASPHSVLHIPPQGWTTLYHLVRTYSQTGDFAPTPAQEESLAAVACAVVRRPGGARLLDYRANDSKTPRSTLSAFPKGQSLLKRLDGEASTAAALAVEAAEHKTEGGPTT